LGASVEGAGVCLGVDLTLVVANARKGASKGNVVADAGVNTNMLTSTSMGAVVDGDEIGCDELFSGSAGAVGAFTQTGAGKTNGPCGALH